MTPIYPPTMGELVTRLVNAPVIRGLSFEDKRYYLTVQAKDTPIHFDVAAMKGAVGDYYGIPQDPDDAAITLRRFSSTPHIYGNKELSITLLPHRAASQAIITGKHCPYAPRQLSNGDIVKTLPKPMLDELYTMIRDRVLSHLA